MRRGAAARSRLGWAVASTLIVLQALGPVAWLVSLSLKPTAELGDGRFLPLRPSLEHYRAALRDPQFPAALVNSSGIAGLATLLAIGLASLAAFAVVRLEFPGRRVVLAAALSVTLFPPISLVGPLFDVWRSAGLFDTWLGLVIPYTAFTLPLAIWILSAFFREIPWELERAARVDGATRFQAFRLVLLPLAAPGVVTAALLVFLFAWNDFLFAAALTSSDRARTVPVALAFFTGSSRFEQPAGAIAAAAVLVTLPAVALVLLLQRRIVAGLTAGAVKG